MQLGEQVGIPTADDLRLDTMIIDGAMVCCGHNDRGGTRRAAMPRKRFAGKKLCSSGTCRNWAGIPQILRRRSRAT